MLAGHTIRRDVTRLGAYALAAAAFLAMNFYDVAFFKVVEPLDDDTAFGSGVHLIHFITEMTQTTDNALIHQLAFTKDSHVTVSNHATLGNAAPGNLRSAASFKDFSDFSAADEDFGVYRVKHAVECLLNVINQLVYDVVVANFHSHAIRQSLCARF